MKPLFIWFNGSLAMELLLWQYYGDIKYKFRHFIQQRRQLEENYPNWKKFYARWKTLDWAWGTLGKKEKKKRCWNNEPTISLNGSQDFSTCGDIINEGHYTHLRRKLGRHYIQWVGQWRANCRDIWQLHKHLPLQLQLLLQLQLPRGAQCNGGKC